MKRTAAIFFVAMMESVGTVAGQNCRRTPDSSFISSKVDSLTASVGRREGERDVTYDTIQLITVDRCATAVAVHWAGGVGGALIILRRDGTVAYAERFEELQLSGHLAGTVINLGPVQLTALGSNVLHLSSDASTLTASGLDVQAFGRRATIDQFILQFNGEGQPSTATMRGSSKKLFVSVPVNGWFTFGNGISRPPTGCALFAVGAPVYTCH